MLFALAFGRLLNRALAPMRERQRAMGEQWASVTREARERYPRDVEAQARFIGEAVGSSEIRAKPAWLSAFLPLAIETLPVWLTQRRQPPVAV